MVKHSSTQIGGIAGRSCAPFAHDTLASKSSNSTPPHNTYRVETLPCTAQCAQPESLRLAQL
eukprot:5905663-Amphidinium_carterae.1